MDYDGNGNFSFSVSADGQTISRLTGTIIAVPYIPKDHTAALALCDQDGAIVAMGSYDSNTALATFSVDTSGRYTIVEQAAAAAASTEPPAPTALPIIFPIILECLFLLIVGWGCVRGMKTRKRTGES